MKLSNSNGTRAAQCEACGRQRWAQQQCRCKAPDHEDQSSQQARWLQRLSDRGVQGGTEAWPAAQMTAVLKNIETDSDETSRQGKIEELISEQGMHPLCAFCLFHTPKCAVNVRWCYFVFGTLMIKLLKSVSYSSDMSGDVRPLCAASGIFS